MGKFKYNIKEIKKPKDVDPTLINRLEKNYGPVKDSDFFNDNLDTYYKTSSVNPETGAVEHKLIGLASFGDSLEKMESAVKALTLLMGTEDAKNDQNIPRIARELKDVFNEYRTHLRKFYPDQYNQIKLTLEEISISGGVGAYSTPYAFRLKGSKPNDKVYKELRYTEVEEGIGDDLGHSPRATEGGVKDNAYVKQFKYKIVPKDKNGDYVQKNSGLEVKQLFEAETPEEFQKKRIEAFNLIESELNNIYKMLSNAKNETINHYNTNSSSYHVIKPTDLILDYIKDIKELLK